MAVKVTLGEVETQYNVKPFPKLMKHNDGTIVLFISNRTGVGLNNVKGSFLGLYSTDWIMEYFTDYDESITLQNE